jgi:WS/DGAT/MGAT family acyltransferase
VLLLDPGPDVNLDDARRLLIERARAVPRLRQRLVPVPPGCGRPIWVDDPAFDPARHIHVVSCPEPGNDHALLELTADLALQPLPRTRPLWAAVLVTGLTGGRIGIVLVLHHVLADGLSGIAVLARLVDGADPVAVPLPRPAPSARQLAGDTWSSRLRALARWTPTTRRAHRSRRKWSGGGAPRAAPCSLLVPTGAKRRFGTAHADLAEVREAAHRHGGTVNDVLVAAAAGALTALLARRGETVGEFRVAVMVAGPGPDPDTPGNRAAPLVVTVPATGLLGERVDSLTGVVRAARDSVTARPTAGVPPTLFRLLAAAGLFRWYMARQRRLHTLVSNLRGPQEPVRLAAAPVARIVPFSVGETGNLTVHFVALSYAGVLTVTAVADPDHVPDLPVLVSALQAELDALADGTRPTSHRSSPHHF